METKDLTVQERENQAIAAWGGKTTGTEHITREDIQMPRMALGQGLTPQVVEQKEGFSVGVLFNSMTEEIYGKGPIKFAIVRADKPRFIEFYPREEGGGIKDMNVPASDPRTQFGKEGEKPAATKFYDFIVAMLPLKPNPMDSVIALSLKSTGIKVAKRLNTLIKLRSAPLYAGIYTVASGVDKNDKGTFAIYKVDNAGTFAPTDPEVKVLEKLFNGLRDKQIIVDREPGADDVEFPPAGEGDQPGDM